MLFVLLATIQYVLNISGVSELCTTIYIGASDQDQVYHPRSFVIIAAAVPSVLLLVVVIIFVAIIIFMKIKKKPKYRDYGIHNKGVYIPEVSHSNN